jgi:hypothetical protein
LASDSPDQWRNNRLGFACRRGGTHERVSTLTDAGDGQPLDLGQGREIKKREAHVAEHIPQMAVGLSG